MADSRSHFSVFSQNTWVYSTVNNVFFCLLHIMENHIYIVVVFQAIK